MRYTGQHVFPFVMGMLSLCGLASQRAQGQAQFHLGFEGLVASPRADFAGFGATEAYGGSFRFGVSTPQWPIVAGATVGIAVYGYESRREVLSQYVPDLEIRVVNTNNIAQGHLFVRLQPQHGRVQPYLEGLLGGNVFFTVTYIDDNYDDSLSSTNYEDTAFSAGPGGGLVVNLLKDREESGRPFELCLDLGITYLFGAEADYLVEGAIERTSDGVVYDVTTSRTNMLTGHLGIVFQF